MFIYNKGLYMDNIYDIIIIGGGPGGIGVSVEAKILGLEKILLIEKSDNHSQTIRKFYKDQKRVDKDWQGQKVELEGNIEFFDGTKETTIDYFDRAIYAIGGTTPVDFLKKCGVVFDNRGEPMFDENYETKTKGMFIAGDIAFSSEGSIAIALNHGYRIVGYIIGTEGDVSKRPPKAGRSNRLPRLFKSRDDNILRK